jgi:cryptochrome
MPDATLLTCSLQVRGSRLVVLRGNPTEVLPKCMKEWAVTTLCFEHDTEPYALKRDAAMKEAAEQAGIEVRLWSLPFLATCRKA